MTGRRAALVLLAGLVASACAPKAPPAMPSPVAWRQPALLGAERAEVMRAYAEAWVVIRQGDLDRGTRQLNGLVRSTPAFAPGWASLGELALARRDYGAATVAFARALGVAPAYVFAHRGAVDAALGRGEDRAALAAIDALLALPAPDLAPEIRDEARTRRSVVALRVVDRVLADARARERAGDLAGARGLVGEGLVVAPDATALLLADARLSLAVNDVGAAEARVRRALALDDRDAAAFGLLADVLERAGRWPEAAAAATRAHVLEPTPARRDRRDALEARVGANLPAPLRGLEAVRAVTRAQVAGWISIRLSGVVAQAPRRQTVVVTDLRGHWVAGFAQALLDVGWMTARPNHTFEPDAGLTRADLAVIVAAALPDVAAGRDAQMARWRAARPDLPGVPPTHAAYAAIRLAVSAGIMTAEGDLFAPGSLVSGADLVATIARLERAAR